MAQVTLNSGTSVGHIADAMLPVAAQVDAAMRAAVTELDGENLDSQKLLTIQTKLNRLTEFTSLQSAITKAIHDMIRDVTNKI